MTEDQKELFYDRDTLYVEVWEHTLIKLCKQYDVSHSALVKACETLNIPRPSVGYWTQKELGKAPSPPVLPFFNNPPSLLIHPPAVEKKIKVTPVKKAGSHKPVVESKPKIETKVGQAASPPDLNDKPKPLQVPEIKPVIKTINWQDFIPKEGIVSPQGFEDAIQLIEKESLPEMAITVPIMAENEQRILGTVSKHGSLFGNG